MTLATVIAVVGPSGVGKDSVMEALAARGDGLQLVRRVITRPLGEEGETFTRANDTEFDTALAAGDFLLYWTAHGLRYGIPVTIHEQRRAARGLLVNLSRSVLLDAQELFDDFAVVSLTASPEVLAARLDSRARESVEDRQRRLDRARLKLPEGLRRVIEVDNSGALDQTVETILSRLQRESA
ncbi:Ribose 1,5-bisphosphate phosphokinase PhnN [Falsiruegeria litorea R37]|uniref:Ribose 1,5-bisphosphate phosphokinase PhnN n=1 Tax=Falsiruegeria litorea R37 TaxID=1200284 RepID=A0A1Y5RRB4_9RHOB|nr:AAA family ATPase [Falsiruegeria litorea]SLN23566.1 Ribose 1,5-bisphosphate phosphokinase PhnN [Falsiruegeria litorea R37]